jgi:hypothetical protein
MPRDILNRVKVIRAISPVSLGATGSGGKTSVVIDRLGYDSAMFDIAYGTVTATAATVDVIVKDGDATGSLTSVADANLLPQGTGQELAASLVATTPRTSGVSKNYTTKIGYKGIKRYVGISLVPHTSGGIIAGVNAILGAPSRQPVA